MPGGRGTWSQAELVAVGYSDLYNELWVESWSPLVTHQVTACEMPGTNLSLLPPKPAVAKACKPGSNLDRLFKAKGGVGWRGIVKHG